MNRVHVVDAAGDGDYSSIGAALAVAQPGDGISVRPGTYREAIVLDKPGLSIEGRPVGAILEADTGPTLRFLAETGRVAGLTLRQVSPGEVRFDIGEESTTITASTSEHYCVEIGRGALELENCDITGRGPASVVIHSGADPVLRGNRIHDGAGSGVWVLEGGRGTLTHNEIFGNGVGGEVTVFDGGSPTLVGNRIHHGRESGVVLYRGGAHGELRGNEIHSHRMHGVEVAQEAGANLTGNHIHDNGEGGVKFHRGGGGSLDGDVIANNKLSGLLISDEGAVTAKNCRINTNGHDGIRVRGPVGELSFHHNDLTGNAMGAWGLLVLRRGKIDRADNLE